MDNIRRRTQEDVQRPTHPRAKAGDDSSHAGAGAHRRAGDHESTGKKPPAETVQSAQQQPSFLQTEPIIDDVVDAGAGAQAHEPAVAPADSPAGQRPRKRSGPRAADSMNDTHVTTPEHRTAGGDALHDPRNNARHAVEALDTTIVMKHPAPPDAVKRRFDELKINFLARYAKADVKSVLFVGTARGDGASTAAFNFATSLAKDNELRVLFINADLRGPPPAFKPLSAGEDESSGSEVLSITHWEPPNPLHEHGDNLQILPGGRGLVDPAVLFQSKRFDQFMLQMSERFDYIVIDGPPLSDAPESIALSTKVDGIILVMDAQRTRRKIALRAKRRIEEVGGKVLGIVLNRRTYYVPGWLYRHI